MSTELDFDLNWAKRVMAILGRRGGSCLAKQVQGAGSILLFMGINEEEWQAASRICRQAAVIHPRLGFRRLLSPCTQLPGDCSQLWQQHH